MVRRTGDYLLGTMFLAAALILQFSQAEVHSAAKSKHNDCLATALVNESAEKHRFWTPHGRLAATPDSTVNAVLTNLPRGTRIVVGSLDMTGGRHQIRLTALHHDPPYGDSYDNSLAVARFSNESVRRLSGPATIRGLKSRPQSARDRQFVQLAAFELQHEENKFLPNISVSTNEQSVRVFLMPHFSSDGTIHQPGECRAIGDSERVLVYVDQSLRQAAISGQMELWSELLISAAELIALPIVEKWIGPVADIDRNDKLSIVITDLDQHKKQSPDRSPIFGCIRESDFCLESHFCGDIVYIDQDLFDLPSAEVQGLLTHEIAHAAICSMDYAATPEQSANSLQKTPFFAKPRATPIPPWLNEAVAHFIELQCFNAKSDSAHLTQEFLTENIQRRIDAFLSGSSVSPIVASENVLNLEQRRSGSRGAATLFLAPLISTPSDLQTLLQSDDSVEDRIAGLAEEPFADVFRNWSLAIASINNDTECLSVAKIAAHVESKHCSLLGTAFQCFECSDEITTLVLTADERAKLQISIIEPAVPDARTERSKR